MNFIIAMILKKMVINCCVLLEQPWSAQGDIKRLHGPEGVIRYCMHIARKFTIFFRIFDEEDYARVDTVMTVEQAHKKFGKYLDST